MKRILFLSIISLTTVQAEWPNFSKVIQLLPFKEYFKNRCDQRKRDKGFMGFPRSQNQTARIKEYIERKKMDRLRLDAERGQFLFFE